MSVWWESVGWNVTGIPGTMRMAEQPLDLVTGVSVIENYSSGVCGGETEVHKTEQVRKQKQHVQTPQP